MCYGGGNLNGDGGGLPNCILTHVLRGQSRLVLNSSWLTDTAKSARDCAVMDGKLLLSLEGSDSSTIQMASARDTPGERPVGDDGGTTFEIFLVDFQGELIVRYLSCLSFSFATDDSGKLPAVLDQQLDGQRSGVFVHGDGEIHS